MIEVRYAGVVVGRSAIVRELDTRGLFLGMTEPMPVGTPIVLRIADRGGGQDVAGRVELVSESQELAHAGMRVRFTDPAAAVLFGTPVEAPPELEPPVAISVPPASSTAAEEAIAAQGASAGEGAAPDATLAVSPSGHRRIVVDASADRVRAEAALETVDDEAGARSGTEGESGRLPAPDPSAFGGSGGGKKGRRNRNR